VEERASGHHQSKSFFTTRAPCWPARRLSSTDCAASATYVPSHSNLLLERAAATPLAAGAATRPASRHLIMIRPPPRPLWSACARCPGPGSSWGSVQPVRALHISPMVAGGASRTAAAPGQPLRRGAATTAAALLLLIDRGQLFFSGTGNGMLSSGFEDGGRTRGLTQRIHSSLIRYTKLDVRLTPLSFIT
jgi:hypothetical protein